MPDSPEPLLLDPADARWRTFVEARPEANVFHHPAWSDLLARCYGYRPFILAVSDDDGALGAGLPLMEVGGRLSAKRWAALPFTDHCAPLARDGASLERLVAALVVLHQTGTAARIDLHWRIDHPAFQAGAPYVLHTLRLEPDAAAVAARFERIHRQNIRAAEKNGVQVEWGTAPEDVRDYYTLQLETRHRKGIPSQPWRFFESLADTLFGRGLGAVLLARREGKCLAGIVLLHWQRTLIAKYAASREDALKLRPNNLLFAEAIRWGCEHGYTLFDMGRTDLGNTGLRRFKSGWGADETLLTYSALPGRAAPSATVGRLMPIVQTVIRRSPRWVCRASGEVLYKYVG